MPQVTKTLHPLPFEHLEPKRFEDLVRQIAYDFRNWRALEALGQVGSDQGFDARGFEIAAAHDQSETQLDEDDTFDTASDRIWLIQCKREGSIGPGKLLDYLNGLPETSIAGLYGIVFAAACKFSKATSDAFKNWAREKNISECYLWGRPEIEDALYQPKNDHLLFAYFGISLQTRRRKESTDLKRVIALRRSLNRIFPQEYGFGKTAVLRDPSDDRYPDVEGDRFEDSKPLWRPSSILGIGRTGLRVLVRRHIAFYRHEDDRWDFASKLDLAIPGSHENPWHDQQMPEEDQTLQHEMMQFWWSLKGGNQYHLIFEGVVPYEEILAVDDVPDDSLTVPTVFMRFKDDGKPPLASRWQVYFSSSSYGGRIWFRPEGHMRVFPERFRNVEWEASWFKSNDILLSDTLVDVPHRDEDGVPA